MSSSTARERAYCTPNASVLYNVPSPVHGMYYLDLRAYSTSTVLALISLPRPHNAHVDIFESSYVSSCKIFAVVRRPHWRPTYSSHFFIHTSQFCLPRCCQAGRQSVVTSSAFVFAVRRLSFVVCRPSSFAVRSFVLRCPSSADEDTLQLCRNLVVVWDLT